MLRKMTIHVSYWSDEIVFPVWSQESGKVKEMFIDCSDQSITAELARKKARLRACWHFVLLISLFIFQFPGRPSLLWFAVPLAYSKSGPFPQPLSSHHPSLCSVLAPSVSCHVRLSSWSRQGSKVSKRTVNFAGWRWRAINNPNHRHTV